LSRNNLTDPAGSPLTCPQYGADPATYSEDCLSLILYVPKTVSGTAKSNVPTILWLHGGSFAFGSATDSGLDGSKLAVATNTIVAVVQYRLGGVRPLIPFHFFLAHPYTSSAGSLRTALRTLV
jgi:acetyl esterase/lipase